jgi:hypothetical protein
MMYWHRTRLGKNIDGDLRRTFLREGVLIIPEFAREEDFRAIVEEFRCASPASAMQHWDGSTLARRFLVGPDGDSFPRIRQFTLQRRLQDILQFAAATVRVTDFFIEDVTHGESISSPDPQKVFHSDTFHPTMKAWLYLTDVDSSNGTFEYIRRSHRLTLRRLVWEYRKSLSASAAADDTAEGSFRVQQEDLGFLKPGEPERFAVKKNTLLVADTRGFHRRGEALTGSRRVALHAWSRTNPFVAGSD